MTAHGFRSVASSWLNEEANFMFEWEDTTGTQHKDLRPFNPDGIERQLAHGSENKVRDCYNRADYMGERETMMQLWADTIDVWADATGKVVPIKKKTA